MGRWESDPLGRLSVTPAAVSAEVLGRLDLPATEELLELTELAVTTLDVALAHDSPELLADNLAFTAHRVAVLTTHQVTVDELRALPGKLLGDTLAPDEMAEVVDLLERATAITAPVAGSSPTMSPLTRRYLEHALSGRREEAVAVVVDAVRRGVDLAVVLVDVLEAAQKEIGRLWEDGEVSIVQEHFCTAVTQLAMSALYPFLFTGATARRRLVAVQAPGSLHEVGLRMVVDLLEHDGWDTTYLGAEAEPARVIDTLVARDARILLVSASMPLHVGAVAALVREVRADPRTSGDRILVGGRPFLVAPALADRVGADGLARDARDAVAWCARVVGADDVAV